MFVAGVVSAVIADKKRAFALASAAISTFLLVWQVATMGIHRNTIGLPVLTLLAYIFLFVYILPKAVPGLEKIINRLKTSFVQNKRTILALALAAVVIAAVYFVLHGFCPSCGRFVGILTTQNDKVGEVHSWCSDCWRDYWRIMAP